MEPARMHGGTKARREGRFSFSKPLIYLLLCPYFLIVVYPMVWLFYTSLKADREIFLHPFSLPDPTDLRWDNYRNAWVKGHFGRYRGLHQPGHWRREGFPHRLLLPQSDRRGCGGAAVDAPVHAAGGIGEHRSGGNRL
jgi:hypothetical protein